MGRPYCTFVLPLIIQEQIMLYIYSQVHKHINRVRPIHAYTRICTKHNQEVGEAFGINLRKPRSAYLVQYVSKSSSSFPPFQRMEELKQLNPRIAHLSQTNDFTFGKLWPNFSARTVCLRCSKRFAVLGTVASGIA